MVTVGRLAKRFGLSRSTLLYYDSIGLLSPSGRSQSDYREYSDQDSERLAQICRYRGMGLSLEQIGRILDEPETELSTVLEARLAELDEEVQRLSAQKQVIAGLLDNDRVLRHSGVMTKAIWVDLLASSGFSPEDMRQWHAHFEAQAPEKHQTFLEFLGIEAPEIEAIRRAAKDASP